MLEFFLRERLKIYLSPCAGQENVHGNAESPFLSHENSVIAQTGNKELHSPVRVTHICKCAHQSAGALLPADDGLWNSSKSAPFTLQKTHLRSPLCGHGLHTVLPAPVDFCNLNPKLRYARFLWPWSILLFPKPSSQRAF